MYPLARGRWLRWWVLGLPVAVTIYASILLVPNWLPHWIWTVEFAFYSLSVEGLALVLILLTASMGGTLAWRVARRLRPSPPLAGVFIATSLSLLGLILVAVCARIVQGDLPLGSWLRKFDSMAWRRPESSAWVEGDIALRQKMLGDLVERVLPGRNRAEIESILGPSSHAEYSPYVGIDLVYPLGAQRNSMAPIDGEWLLIWLDPNGRFERYDLHVD